MKKELKHNGFSLTEVLMAVGILSIGMMLIATMFPVGIYLTTVATERTMAAIVYDEAIAKIQLYGLNISSLGWTTPNYQNCTPYELVSQIAIDPNEFSYPSVDPATKTSQYYWSALCRLKDPNDPNMLYQVTVFVARKTGPNLKYWHSGGSSDRPKPTKIAVSDGNNPDELKIITSGEAKYVNPPTAVLDNASGVIYHVLDRQGTVVKLDRLREASMNPIWLIPPPETGGRNADIEVYPTTIRF